MRPDQTPARAPAATRGWRSRLLARLVVSVVALLAAPAAVQAALTASIVDLNLPAVTSSHVAQTSTGTMRLTVTDSAPGAGWNVTILSSAVVYSGPHGGTTIFHERLTMSDLIYRALDVPADTHKVLHTVTTGKQASFTVRFCNRTTNEVAVRLALAAADIPTPAEYIEYDAKIVPHGVLNNSGLILPGNYRIIGYCALEGVSMTAFIYED